MDEGSSKGPAEDGLFAGDAWFDPLEAGIRGRIRGLIEELVEQELEAALGRGRYGRGAAASLGHRHGHRMRQLTGSFGPVEVAVPWARLRGEDGGGTREWRSAVLPRYARRTRQLEALIAGAYLAGTNTRRVQRALAALFRGALGKDVVSRAWCKVKVDWEALCRRDLAGEDVVRLILDDTVVRVRLDRRATSISLLVVPGVRRDGQEVLLTVRDMGGEGEAAWRAVLDDLVARGLRTPEFLIIDGAAGLERALAALWPDVPAQRCTVRTIRTQSLWRSGLAAAAWWRWAQGDDMADLQPAVADDDALDQKLQDRPLIGETCLIEAAAHAAAELY
jgi:putative transposase